MRIDREKIKRERAREQAKERERDEAGEDGEEARDVVCV
jgi:hypothetical protein